MENNSSKNTIFVAPNTKDEYPFWLCQFGKTSKHTPSHQIRPHSHVSCIQYVISGSGIVISDDHTFNVRQGDTFILSEEKNQNYYSNSDGHFERIWINFKGVLGKELLKIYGLENTIILRNTNSLNLLMEIHEKCRLISDPEEYKKESAGLFLKLVQFLNSGIIFVSCLENRSLGFFYFLVKTDSSSRSRHGFLLMLWY